MRLTLIALALTGAITAARADDDPMAFARAGMASRARHGDGGTTFAPPMQLTGARMLDEAQRFAGLRHSPTGFRGPWCADFVAFVGRRVGADVPRDYRIARSWARAGTRSAPSVGALAVFRHHVTIIAQIVPGGFVGLGGNQHHRVQESFYSWRGVIAIRRV